MNTDTTAPTGVVSSTELGLVDELRAVTPEHGWAVVNTKTDGIVIWFSGRREFDAERKAREWLAEHASTHRTHEVKPYKDRCMEHDAADSLERLHGEAGVLRAWITAALVPLQAIADLEDFEDGGDGMNALIATGRTIAFEPNTTAEPRQTAQKDTP